MMARRLKNIHGSKILIGKIAIIGIFCKTIERKLKPPKPEVKIFSRIPLSVKFPEIEEGKNNVN